MLFSPAQCRYNRRVLWASVVYAALIMLSVYLLSRHLVTGVLAYIVGVLPALAVSSFFWLMARYLLEETDEYLRMRQIRQLLIATGVSLTAATIWGFLEGFGLVRHLVAYAWPIVYFGGQGVGVLVDRQIERRAA